MGDKRHKDHESVTGVTRTAPSATGAEHPEMSGAGDQRELRTGGGGRVQTSRIQRPHGTPHRPECVGAVVGVARYGAPSRAQPTATVPAASAGGGATT